MRNSLKCLVMLSTVVFSAVAFADETADQLTKIEAETLILKARERQLQVQASILAKQNEIAANQNAGTVVERDAAAGDPVVRSVEGIGSRTYATLQLSDGSMVDVQAGDTLSNGMRIISIRSNGVIATSKKRGRIRLAAYASVTPQFNPTYPSPGLMLPLPPAPPRGVAR